MTITPEEWDILKTFGPYVLSAAGFVLAGIFTAIAAVAKYAWKSHQRRMEMMATALTELAKGIKSTGDMAQDEHKKIWDAIQGLRAELQLSTQRTEHVKAGLLKVEGSMVTQCDRIDRFIAAMTVVNSKLDAVFKVFDAPKRATDIG